MELELSRVDYTMVGITNPNCLSLLAGSLPKFQCKVAIADSDGILQFFSVKKDEIQLHFKTLPGPPVVSVKVLGSSGPHQGKIFIASGNEVRGYSKRGKLFLSFDSGMTEPISTMFVMENDLFLCGKHIFTHYRDCKDIGSYLCGDKIVDIVVFYAEKTRRLMCLLACEGRMIRALEHARVTFSMEVESSPTVLHIYEGEDHRSVLFGTVDGRVGLLDVESLQGFKKWILPNSDNTSAVCTMDSYDLNESGVKQLIVGRQNGMVEVYQINIEEEQGVAKLIYSYDCSESVTAVQCGVVAEQGFDEILVATYTGRIFGLTTQPVNANIENTDGRYVLATDSSLKIQKLKSEIEELKNKIMKEREKYQSLTLSLFNDLSAIPLLAVNERFLLDRGQSLYNLTIEVPTAIDNVLLQCDTQIDVIDEEKNSAVVCFSDSNPEDDNIILVTYRCQINVNHLELKVRTIEGHGGTFVAYVTPMVQPKCTRKISHDIKPLSLHYRLNNMEDRNRSFNILSIKGTFSLLEIHHWIALILPEVPDKPEIAQRCVLWFESSLLGTLLECSYQQGKAEFKSDNISSLSILKGRITQEATKKKIGLDINISVNDESVKDVLRIIDKKVLALQKLEKDNILLEALLDIEVSDEESSKYLSNQYKDLLRREKDIKKMYKIELGNLQRFYDLICTLYHDYKQFRGMFSKLKEARLKDIIANYSLEELLEFFASK